MKKEVKIFVCRCQKTKQLYGIRIEKINGTWYRTWAFKMTENQLKHENYGNETISGAFPASSTYPGCPYCGNKNFAQCFCCNHIGCASFSDKTYTCLWCGDSSELQLVESLDISADGF